MAALRSGTVYPPRSSPLDFAFLARRAPFAQAEKQTGLHLSSGQLTLVFPLSKTARKKQINSTRTASLDRWPCLLNAAIKLVLVALGQRARLAEMHADWTSTHLTASSIHTPHFEPGCQIQSHILLRPFTLPGVALSLTHGMAADLPMHQKQTLGEKTLSSSCYIMPNFKKMKGNGIFLLFPLYLETFTFCTTKVTIVESTKFCAPKSTAQNRRVSKRRSSSSWP